jgi:hypothetical protein
MRASGGDALGMNGSEVVQVCVGMCICIYVYMCRYVYMYICMCRYVWATEGHAHPGQGEATSLPWLFKSNLPRKECSAQPAFLFSRGNDARGEAKWCALVHCHVQFATSTIMVGCVYMHTAGCWRGQQQQQW